MEVFFGNKYCEDVKIYWGKEILLFIYKFLKMLEVGYVFVVWKFVGKLF